MRKPQERPLFVELAHRLWGKKREVSFVSLLSYMTLLTTFITQVVLARLLGPESYGIFIASLAIIALVEVPLVVRSSEVSLRQIGAYWQRGGRNISDMVRRVNAVDRWLFVSVFILMGIASSWLSALSGAEQPLFLVLTLIIPAQLGYGVYRSYFVIFNIIPEMVKFEMAYALMLLMLSVAGYLIFGLYGLAWAMVLSMLLKTFLAYRFTKSSLPTELEDDFELQDDKFGRDSFFSVFRNLCSNGINQIDIVLLAAFQPPQMVAIYKVAKSLSALPTKISFPVWRYLQPKMLQAVQSGSQAKMRRIVIYGAAILLLIIALILPLVWVLGHDMIIMFYGESYKEAYTPFIILLLGVWAFNGVTGWFKFWSVISQAQLFNAMIYFMMLAALAALGSTVGGAGPTEMAYVVSGVFVFFSALITIKIFVK